MAPTHGSSGPGNGVERVRHQLLTALHFGKLTPGDRVLSVRRLADLTGMNRKTVHRAYTRLAREGLLDLRPGSGTFIAEGVVAREGSPPLSELISAANRCRDAAKTLGLSPSDFTRFLDVYLNGGLRDLQLTVAECNFEQIGFISAELQNELGVRVRPVLLSDLRVDPRTALDRSLGIVTTDCHRQEVVSLTRSLSVPVYRVALDPSFPRQIVEQAEQHAVILVIQDGRFAPVLLRLMQQMPVAASTLDRITFVAAHRAARLLAAAEPGTVVYISPLIERALRLPRRNGLRCLSTRWRIEPGAMERLRARLALDLATTLGSELDDEAVVGRDHSR